VLDIERRNRSRTDVRWDRRIESDEHSVDHFEGSLRPREQKIHRRSETSLEVAMTDQEKGFAATAVQLSVWQKEGKTCEVVTM
jgi:hypothetical protein